MIKRDKIFCGFSARNIDEAYNFYKNVLGLDVEKDEMSVLTIKVNTHSNILIYPKQDHVPATYTVLNIPVTDIDQAVDELGKQGISFLQYDQEEIKTDAKGIARNTEGPAIAWFMDPSENIIALMQD